MSVLLLFQPVVAVTKESFQIIKQVACFKRFSDNYLGQSFACAVFKKLICVSFCVIGLFLLKLHQREAGLHQLSCLHNVL